MLQMIASQFELILEVREFRNEGISASEIQRLLGVHEFRIKKAMGFAERYSAAELKRILMAVYSVDRNIKTGLLEQSLALEMLIAEI